MIDMILIRRKWATSVQQCRTFQGADIDSDHSLDMANIKIKLKKKHKAQFRIAFSSKSCDGPSNLWKSFTVPETRVFWAADGEDLVRQTDGQNCDG